MSIGKNILITGGAGFIGANFVHHFVSLGCQIFVFEKKNVNLWRLKNVKNKIKIYETDWESFEMSKLFFLFIAILYHSYAG